MRFQCQPGCIACCQKQGFVYLTEQDIERAAEFLGLSKKKFEGRYIYRTRNTRRLRTPSPRRMQLRHPSGAPMPRHAQCVFLGDGGCAIHLAKPAQCRLFPFWPELVDNKKEWHKTAAWCPGIGQGELVPIAAARQQASAMRAAYPHMYK